MSLHVLEFNDAGLRLSDASGILLSSPGYAYVDAKEIEFGESARKRSKVYPLSSYNQFWHKLSLDPFSKPVGNFRHNADIAFSHLQDIARNAQLEGDVVLAVPGSFSREQMAILLGLLKQSPMRPVGLVDAALMASIDQVQHDSVIHIDLQLHQVVLSKMQRVGSELKRESVVLVPGAGWMNISDNLMHLFTSAFIQQCRFNPQHNAASEQMLLDNLPQWLSEESIDAADDDASVQDSRSSLQVRLTQNNTVHRASLPRSALHSRLLPFFQKIAQQLAVIDPEGSAPLLVSDHMQCLPGFESVLSSSVQGVPRSTHLLGQSSVAQACFDYRDALLGAPDALHFVSKISANRAATPASVPSAARAEALPTHLLLGHQARRLTDGLLICVSKHEQGLSLLQPEQAQALAAVQVVGELVVDDGNFAVHSKHLLINGSTLEGRHALRLGDRLSAAGLDVCIELIRVQDHHE
tara:strand:- start:65 stop:1465 length:1401 start_codon:yes stop_codon:yes gene_type:complete